MSPADNLERSIRELRCCTTTALDQRILEDARAAMRQTEDAALVPQRPGAWRIIVRSNWTKLAGAAAIVAAVVTLSLTALHQSAAPAYAIEQTQQANRGLRYIHIRVESSTEELEEAWLQLDPQGQLEHLRLDLDDKWDGPKIAVWQTGKADVWFKAKNRLVTVYNQEDANKFLEMLKAFDPQMVVNALCESQAAGRVKVEMRMPAGEDQTIVLVATSVPKGERQDVYRVDPASKLVQRVERYKLSGGRYELQSAWDYLDYNQTPDPSVFVLNPPADVVRIDQTAQPIGLPKGDLSDGEISTQVVRQFFEALIAKDYAEAGRLLSGLPATEMERAFGGMTFLRIDSIAEPVPRTGPGGGMMVECRVEVETDGSTTIREFRPLVRPVHGQPDRWEIFGGI